MGNVANFAVQKKTPSSYPGAIRKTDEFLAANAERIPGSLLTAGVRDVLIHFAAKEAEGRVVMFALPEEGTSRVRSEFQLVTALLGELPTPDSTREGRN